MVTYNGNKVKIEIKDDCPDFYVSKLAECLAGIIVGQKDDFFYLNQEHVNNALMFLRELLPDTNQVLRGYAKYKGKESIAN
ncbi:hypothetical protein [Hoylesella marshii]|jgi:hypothetical protein|uniref:Uncharacterized protein n=1 Tax=Hoylesella marshii DSM 16973 = JCM 13450 TaxID=862515 RepID=E0NSN2_9BACT|nr:hypothetical protein [Hoylesella marshii]EFM01875.1 hypothetical protein HMPREF0658_1183 [Hoylesella marshii DSM 16973 = JCM 13450]